MSDKYGYSFNNKTNLCKIYDFAFCSFKDSDDDNEVHFSHENITLDRCVYVTGDDWIISNYSIHYNCNISSVEFYYFSDNKCQSPINNTNAWTSGYPTEWNIESDKSIFIPTDYAPLCGNTFTTVC